MAGINVNQITSMLAKLQPDLALQQYAQMHKNDPYIVSLAAHESNRRKEARLADQAAQGAQPQPKVVDVAIAQMAPQPMPEDVGIGQLRAPNMQFGAEGGIMGYDEGYDEGGMTYGQDPVMMMADGGVVRYQVGGATKAGPEFMRFLKQIGFDLVEFSAMDPDGKAQLVDMFEQYKTATPAATTSAAPAAQQATQAGGRMFEAGKAVRPYLDKAGKLVKTGALPVVGAGLSAAQGLSEVDTAQQFYNDPNVSMAEKAKQFARTGVNVAAPYVGGAIGLGMGPLGAVAGAGAGAGVAALVDDEGEALRRYRAKNEPPKGPTAAQNRSALNKADAAVFGQPGQPSAETVPAGAAADTRSVTKPSSVLSGAALSGGRTGAGNANVAGNAPANALRDEKGIASLYSDLLKTQKYEDPAKGEVDKLAQEQLAAATKRKQEYEDYLTKQGDVYKDRSDRLVEREKGIGKQIDQNVGMALLNAGLSIMSTPGGLATAIGKGAQVGTAQYAAGLDRINAARDRLNDAKDKMDELRMNRDEMTFKQRSALEADIDKAKTDARKMGIDGIRAAAGVTEQRAGKLLDKVVDLEKTRFEQSEMTKRTLATIRASTDGRTKQLWAGLMQKHNNDPVAAAKEYNAIETGDKTNLAAEKLVQDRVGEWEKANKLRLSMMKPAEQAAELRSAEQRLRNDIYTQLKLTPTMGAGASSSAGFKFRGVEPAQ